MSNSNHKHRRVGGDDEVARAFDGDGVSLAERRNVRHRSGHQLRPDQVGECDRWNVEVSRPPNPCWTPTLRRAQNLLCRRQRAQKLHIVQITCRKTTTSEPASVQEFLQLKCVPESLLTCFEDESGVEGSVDVERSAAHVEGSGGLEERGGVRGRLLRLQRAPLAIRHVRRGRHGGRQRRRAPGGVLGFQHRPATWGVAMLVPEIMANF
jgi:hypothetical protein